MSRATSCFPGKTSGVSLKLWALGDPHLSLGGEKPMDVFGPAWRDHVPRLSAAWDRAVESDDVVLLAGDVSWARRLAEARVDLEFLAARPGRLKVLLRGNHDSWWTSAAQVRAALPAGLVILQNDALRLPEGVVLCGARGWNPPGTPFGDPEKDPPLFRRELDRLDLSLAHAAELRRPGDILVAVLHYPPVGPGESASEVLERLNAAGAEVAVYGHLHGEDHASATPRPLRRRRPSLRRRRLP